MESFEKKQELYQELIKGLDIAKEHPEKFIASLMFAKKENKDLLDEYEIKLKPCDWMVLAMDSEILKKTILRAKDLLFLDAYIQNPSFLKADVEGVIKRISEFDSLGIPYKNENGKYMSYLFSARASLYVKNNMGKKKQNEVNDVELRELADRIMETYAFLDKKDEVYKTLMVCENNGKSIKESLMEAFSKYSDNLDALSNIIDDVISLSKESRGR